MNAIFGDKKTMKQKIREIKRIVNRSIREIDREMNRLKREKKKGENEAKRLAKQGQNDGIRHLCKDIVKMTNTEQKFIKLKSELRSLSSIMDQGLTNSIFQKTIKRINNSLTDLKYAIKLPELTAMINEYSIQSECMEMKQDMINDALDDALDVDSDAEDEMVQKIMDEIGLDLVESLQTTKSSYSTMECMDECDDALSSRLARLSGYSNYNNNNYNNNNNDTVGLSVGGSKDVNNFRKCIENNIMPSIGSITYNGLLYEYYFDTKTRKHVEKNIVNNNNDEKKDNDDDGSMLFYPSYCYAKTKINNEYEYYMTVGLNSNIKQSDFKRKHLNLIVVLDKSGSMSSRFYGDTNHKSKMQVANESVVALLKHLTPKDRFGLITFDSDAATRHNLQFVNDINMDKLKQLILSINQSGGTNFETGYAEAIKSYDTLFEDDDYKLNSSINNDYDNRIIFLTDAKPNSGRTDENSLLGMVQKYAENVPPNDDVDKDEYIRNRIYTTFIGIGVDFNANLIESISQARGCNYYSVKSTKDFMDKMDEEFEYMVTPLVFNVLLKLNCEGNSCQIDKVYGSSKVSANNIIKNGEISRIDTLFPAKKRPKKKGGGTRGGIQLIKLKKTNNDNDNINVELLVSFEDRNGKKYKNQQIVAFEASKMNENNYNMKSDMIENDEDEEEKENFYDNTGIRKGILLCKYIELMISWIKDTQSGTLKIDNKYKNLFSKFMEYFKKEMKKCNDNDLTKEIEIMEKLVNLNTSTSNDSNYSNNPNTASTINENEDDDLQRRLAMLAQ